MAFNPVYLAIIKHMSGCLMALSLSWGGICVLFYAEIKTLFHLTQTQVEILAGAHVAALHFVLPYSILFTRFGLYPTFFAGSFVAACGYLLMSLAARLPESFLGLPVLLYLYMVLFTNGRCGVLFALIQEAMNTKLKAHSGKAVSSTIATMFIGSCAIAPIYNAYFADVTKTSEYFFICAVILIGTASVYIPVVAVFRKADTLDDPNSLPEETEKDLQTLRPDQEQNFKELDKKSIDVPDTLEKKPPDSTDDDTILWKRLIFSYRFQLYIWSASIVLSPAMVYFTNSCLLFLSLKQENYENEIIATIYLGAAVSHLASGSLYDLCRSGSSKVGLIIATCVSSVISFAIVLMFMGNVAVVFLSLFVMSITKGGGFSIYINFSQDLLGLKHAAIVQGICLTFYQVFCFVVSSVIGIIYDYFADQQKSSVNMCYGKECYWWSFLLLLGLSLIGTGLSVLLWYDIKSSEHRSDKEVS